ncbi:anthrone oxygenase family protein [Spongiactinospora sp. 9N601]|uniref:anthrone oxygenase family protein n=1 Tax=Spongiactinospora sp. 9N601 TaxID=3375149 RepID=UPI00378A96B7
MTELLLPVALFTNGIAAGVLVGTMLGVVPFYRTLGAPEYVRAHAFSSTRYDPFQPICLVTTLVIDTILAATVDAFAARALCAAAAVTTLGVVIISVSRNVPMNRWIVRQDPDAMPADWDFESFRANWARWNGIRATVAILAFVFNISAAVALLALGL